MLLDRRQWLPWALALGLAACGDPGQGGAGLPGPGHDPGIDASEPDGTADGGHSSWDANTTDGATLDAGSSDGTADNDGGQGGSDGGSSGVLDGGPCISGASGITAYRVRWADGGSTTYPIYEVNGLPDKTRDHTGAYGYQIGFDPSFVDPYLGDGGLLLNSSDFVDIELSTAGVSSISSATLSIFGRSYNTTTSGSFNWQTFSGVGAAPGNLVSNAAPYQWYSADMTAEIEPGDDGVLLRIKAGPSSNSLVVHRIELCMEAE